VTFAPGPYVLAQSPAQQVQVMGDLAVARWARMSALLSERSFAAAARRCDVNEKTLRRWMADDEAFKRDLTTLMSRTMPPTVRLGAARTVAELGIHQHDAETILRKLEDIEACQRKQQSR